MKLIVLDSVLDYDALSSGNGQQRYMDKDAVYYMSICRETNHRLY
jgi:hypothetical protein